MSGTTRILYRTWIDVLRTRMPAEVIASVKSEAIEIQLVDLPAATFYGFRQLIKYECSRAWILELR